MRIIRLGLGVLGAALIAAWVLDGPFWLLTVPSGVNPAVRSAMARLKSWRGATRAAAATDLRVLGSAGVAAAPALVSHLDDTGWADPNQGWSTMYAFHGGPSLVFTKAYDALAAMGPGAVPALIDGMRNPSERVRMCAAELLGGAGDPRALPVLRAAVLGEPSASVQNISARALRQLHDRSVFDQVAARLHDPDSNRRVMAPVLVESLAGADAVPLLREAAQDPDVRVRGAAEAALQRALGTNP
jgi:HEAT repeat protein